MKTTIIALFTAVITCLPALTQEIKWNNAPRHGFVYEITNREAQKLLTGKLTKNKISGLLHTRIDTFDVQKGWIDRPSKGHFLLVKITGTKLYYSYTCVFPYQVFLLREYNALSIQVLDPEGNIRDDARVKMGFKRIRNDAESKAYRVESDGIREGNHYVTVELDGFRSVFDIQKHEVPTWYNYGDEDEGPDFYSYLITDKNKYKPGERVRFKSYALSHVKFPLRKELEICLSGYPKTIKLGSISPHRPGSYAGEFILHDSLKLVLDKNYTLQLREKNGRTVSSCYFKYEDYELTGNRLDLILDKSTHYFPENNRMTISATDVNGLILKDAKADIVIKTNTVLETFQPLSVLPDTLFFTSIALDSDRPTVLDIPCELFKQTNTAYQVTVTVLNSQNQRIETIRSATFYYSNYELVTGFSNDSICFNLLKNNIPMDNVPASMRINNNTDVRAISFPYKEKLNPAIISYYFSNEFIDKVIPLSSLNPQIELTGGIQKDSFNIALQNPRQLEVSWYIYQGSRLLSKGFGRETEYKSLIEDRTQTYYVELLYSFGGKDQAIRRQYEFREDYLNVSLDIPDRIYPGQQVNATISVSDQSGHPVRNVDLTAMSVTGKLDYYIPDLPYYGSGSSPRPKSATYSKEDLNSYETGLELDYPKWAPVARLDTMLYYRFRYPDPQGFVYSLPVADSTQFAPFVMQKGRSKQIYVIEVDRRPVYYSWTNQIKGYSFYIAPAVRHEITLRLSDRVLVLDSMSFGRNTKTIISIDLDRLPYGTKTHLMENKFTPTERSRHTSYIAQFKVVPYSYAYLQSEHEFFPLFSRYNPSSRRPNYGSIIAGPILQEKKTYSQNDKLKTTYQHTGGFDYAFEDNIVYKLTPPRLIPDLLTDSNIDPMEYISDKAINEDIFRKLQEERHDYAKWEATILDIKDSFTRLRIFLPLAKDMPGIAAMLFENCQTGKIVPPTFNRFYHNLSGAYSLPQGYHSIIVLYENGNYLKADSVLFRKYTSIALNLSDAEIHCSDNASSAWLTTYLWMHVDYGRRFNEPPGIRAGAFYTQLSTGNVTGTVYDENNEPLPGVVIMVNGTEYGTITDIAGNFALQIDDYQATISISFIGFKSKEMLVTRGSVVVVQLEPDITALEEVVVVGYGISRKSELTTSIALQGRVAGISIESDTEAKEAGVPDNVEEDSLIYQANKRLYQELLTLNSIRSNFSDVGFWEPRLYTDRKGQAGFSVTFPDDITRWDAVVYAMNRYAQTGTSRKAVRSYKPLMAELNVPQFLTRGDSSLFLGKVLNYTSDSIIEGKVEWSGVMPDWSEAISFSGYHTDLLPVLVTNTDSITTRYSFRRDDGYFDGEERTIPVVKQGAERAEGTLRILKNGDHINVIPSGNEKVTVTLLDNQLDIYAQEINSLLHYRYDCNEQLASKLIGLINHKKLTEYEGRRFQYNSDVNRIIRRLLKNQNKEFLWSWWDMSENTSYWMSAHILTALKCARDAGYDVAIDVENIARKAAYRFDFLRSYSITDIDLLHTLAGWNVSLNYAYYVSKLDSVIAVAEKNEKKLTQQSPHAYTTGYSYLKEKLLLQEIRQMKGLQYQRDLLLKYKKEGILGDVYFMDNKPARYWYTDNVAANIIAYRIVRNDSLLGNLLAPMQMHFITSRGHGGWNTYQASGILLNVLPDLLKEGYKKGQTATVQLTGKENKIITSFPYTLELNPDERLHIQKESGLPLFCMQYVNERVTEARTGVEGFRINSYFRTSTLQLEAGKPVDLIVDVTVEKQSPVENVMIEVPIPGACSYADKRQAYRGAETYREYFKEKTLICCEKLSPGKYSFSIQLLPRFTGKYYLNPAQVSLMYIPVVNANTDMKRVVVE